MRFLSKSWWAQIALAALLLLAFDPYAGKTFDVADPSKMVANHDVILALGLLHRGIYPCFSLKAQSVLTKGILRDPEETRMADLSTWLPKNFWPEGELQNERHRGADPGIVFLIYSVWKTTGIVTLDILVKTFELLHVVAALALFTLLWRVRVPFFAFMSTLSFLFSPVVLRTLFGYSAYFVSPVATILCALVFFTARQGGGSWVLMAMTGVLLAFAGFIRSTTFYLLIPFTIVLLFGFRTASRRNTLFLTACLLISALGTKVLISETFWTPRRLSENQIKGHIFWHAIWCGLGEFPNPYGFSWSDTDAKAFVKAQDPRIVFASPEFERVLRRHVVTTLAAHPVWAAGVVVKRVMNFARTWSEYFFGRPAFEGFSVLLFSCSIFGGIGLAIVSRDWEFLRIFGVLGFDLGVPFLILSSSYFYNLTSYVALSTALCYVGMKLLEKMTNRLCASPS